MAAMAETARTGKRIATSSLLEREAGRAREATGGRRPLRRRLHPPARSPLRPQLRAGPGAARATLASVRPMALAPTAALAAPPALSPTRHRPAEARRRYS